MAHHDREYVPYGGSAYAGAQQPFESSPYSYPPAVEHSTYDSYRAYGQPTHSEDSFNRNPARTSYHPSPFKTPFDDENAYQSSNPSSYTLTQSNPHDPFSDSTAIPLQSQKRSHQDGFPPPLPGLKDAEQQPYPPYQMDPREPAPPEKSGWFHGKNRIPIACYVLSLVQIIVFIYELVRSAQLTGSPIEIHPTFNPVIGPSPYVLINVGSRYVPCMREYDVPGAGYSLASPLVTMPCPNATSNDYSCHLAELCGFGLNLTPKADGSQPQPNQWFRFIVPIFMHGGFIHIGFNLLLQLTIGRDIERQIGTVRFLLVYFSAGIFGFVFGANFSPVGLMSTGCSGALFGIMAILLLDLLYTWKSRRNPVRELMFILLDIALSFVLGLLPALDNFSHIGGFLTGLALGVCLLRSPDSLRQRIGLDEPPYSSVGDSVSTVPSFVKQPVAFFKGRKPLWWTWWIVRAGGLVLVIVCFIVLLRNFYIFKTTCSWCKYLSCLPIKNWCEIGNLSITNTTTSN